MLHIHNGDATADKLRTANFPGEHFAFREALAVGPTPRGLSQAEWIAVRARHLAERGVPGTAEEIAFDLEAGYRALEDLCGRREEVVLWFEHDLFCQVNLVFLLDHFSRGRRGTATLSLVCVGEFPGRPRFRGLGELTAAEMASLFGARRAVSPGEFETARETWAALQSPDPRAVERLLHEDTSALPYLRDALLQHLGRFPSVENGLGRAQETLLGLVAAGPAGFVELCEGFFAAEPSYGLGDFQVWRDLHDLARPPVPLLSIERARPGSPAFSDATCAITDAGKRVLEGNEDFVALNGLDTWLGGVHLSPDNLWRWDRRKLTLHRA